MTWPINEIEYGSYDWLGREVGVALDYGADEAAWSHEQRGVVDSCIQSGYKLFCFPPADKDGAERYKWRFLTPTAVINLTSGVDTENLPDDFAGGLECFTFSTGNTNRKIPIIQESELRSLKNMESATSAAPKFAAIRPRPNQGDAEQRWEVMFYPTPNTAYELSYSYSINPKNLSKTNKYPLGGTGHSETILEAVLAVAEDRILKKPRGPHRENFLERLAASISLDNQTKTPSAGSWQVTEPVYGTYGYFSREVGAFMGYGYNPNYWSYDQERKVNSIVQSGFRQFYSPPPVEGSGTYEWSFLRPVKSMSLTTDTSEYDLPTDFGYVVDDMTYSVNSKEMRIQVVSDATLRSQQSGASASGAPKYCCVRPKATDYTAQQAWELSFYPTPDKAYTVKYRYNVSPPDASSANLYPLGGRSHAETVLASCLAVAEISKDGKQGAQHERFRERLAASVLLDKKSQGIAGNVMNGR